MNHLYKKIIITSIGHFLVHSMTMVLPAILVILGKEFSISLFRLGQLVTIQILFLGKHPYATSSDSTIVADMANMNFPYLRSNKRLKIAPYGSWRYIYSNLTYVLKDKFFRIFKYGEMISINEWINALNNYIYSLKVGHFSMNSYHHI